MIDIFDFDTGVAMDIKDAIADVAINGGTAELIGRVVQQLVNAGTLNVNQLRTILPDRYQVRE